MCPDIIRSVILVAACFLLRLCLAVLLPVPGAHDDELHKALRLVSRFSGLAPFGMLELLPGAH